MMIMDIKEVRFNNFMRFENDVSIKFNDGITVFYGPNGSGKQLFWMEFA